MNSLSKLTTIQTYTIYLYRKALHPEFFEIINRKRIVYGDYDFEGWLFRGGHCIRFECGDLCICEVISPDHHKLPERGLVTTFPCAGERDHEESFSDLVEYITTMQTETLSDHLYLGTYNEMLEHGKESDCLMHSWKVNNKVNLSLLDIQRYATEVHLQGYHLRSDCGLVLRTQSMLRVLEEKKS